MAQQLPNTLQQQKMECLHQVLNSLGCEPSGPIYQSTNKHLAKLLLSSGDEEQASYHLCESLGTTLRNKTLSLIDQQLGRTQDNKLQDLKERLAFQGPWQSGTEGLYKRLAELPKEWTVVQLTLEWDVLSRFPPRNRDINRGLGTYLTRFTCGDLSMSKVDDREREKPISIFLPALDGSEEQLSLMAAMRNHLSKMDSKVRVNRSQIHKECSLGVEATAKELQSWIGGWYCLFLGRLTSEALSRAIKTAVDSILESYNPNKSASQGAGDSKTKSHISEKTVRILYLLASAPAITLREISQVVSSLIEDQNLEQYLSKNISDVVSTFSVALCRAKRNPVVLLIDEELDILPFEIISGLEDQAFSRMPSIHFLHALYYHHKNTTFKYGIDTQSGFYVVNPSNDLPGLEKVFEGISSNVSVQKWKGFLSKIPQPDQFLNGLKESDIFLYCGHGGGNQFVARDTIERCNIKSVVLLFGCSSSSLESLGGRVEMSSLSYSYLIAGSPCVVGMLWPVLDTDVNAMTKQLVDVWCGSDKGSESDASDIDSVATGLKNLKLHPDDGKGPVQDLARAVSIARKAASRFLNKAALVVRGLPVQKKGFT